MFRVVLTGKQPSDQGMIYEPLKGTVWGKKHFEIMEWSDTHFWRVVYRCAEQWRKTSLDGHEIIHYLT